MGGNYSTILKNDVLLAFLRCDKTLKDVEIELDKLTLNQVTCLWILYTSKYKLGNDTQKIIDMCTKDKKMSNLKFYLDGRIADENSIAEKAVKEYNKTAELKLELFGEN